MASDAEGPDRCHQCGRGCAREGRLRGGQERSREKVSRGLGEGSVARHLGRPLSRRGEEGGEDENIILEVASGA